jgi:hypothetical protein
MRCLAAGMASAQGQVAGLFRPGGVRRGPVGRYAASVVARRGPGSDQVPVEGEQLELGHQHGGGQPRGVDRKVVGGQMPQPQRTSGAISIKPRRGQCQHPRPADHTLTAHILWISA